MRCKAMQETLEHLTDKNCKLIALLETSKSEESRPEDHESMRSYIQEVETLE